MTSISPSLDSRTSGTAPSPLAALSGRPEFTPAVEAVQLARLRALRRAWRQRAAKKSNTALQTLLYCLLLRKPLDAAFSPVTNQCKLANGRYNWGTLDSLLLQLRSESVVLAQLKVFDQSLVAGGEPLTAPLAQPSVVDLVASRARAAREALRHMPA